MKGLLAIAVIILAGLYVFYPYVSKEKACYDNTKKVYDNINYNHAARGWSLEDVCRDRTAAILELETCIDSAETTGTLAVKTRSFIRAMVSLIRPMDKGIVTLKADHNTECSEFETYQVE